MPKFDLKKTQEVVDLFEVERESRDEEWRQKFYVAIVDASMATPKDQVLQGPDGFPYFVLNAPPPNEGFETFCVSHILDTCLKEGLGIVVQPEPGPPQWVFPYGLLWSFKEFGAFEMAEADTGEHSHEEEQDADDEPEGGASVLTSQPSASFFPAYARKVIKDFLQKRVGSSDLQVMMVNDPQDDPQQSLSFNIFAEDFQDQQQFSNIMYRLTWFLPRHYGLVSMSKGSDLAKSFQPL